MDKLVFNKDVSFCIDNVYCKYYLCDVNKPLLITFAGAAPNVLVNKIDIEISASPWGFNFIKKQNLNVISFASIESPCWYQSNIFYKFLEELAKQILIFNERLGYGTSMGGYGVSAYSNTLNLTRVLLLSPISTLDKVLVPFEKRYGIDEISPTWKGLDAAKINAPCYIVYDNLFRFDKKHAERYKDLIPLRLPGVGHAIAPSLLIMNIIKNLFDNFIKNKIDTKIFHIDAKKRRKIPRYYDFMMDLNKDKMTPLRKTIILKYRKENIQTIAPPKNIIEPYKVLNEDINNLRDIAISLEKTNIKEAYILMKLALKLRPTGGLLLHKVREYKKILDVLDV